MIMSMSPRYSLNGIKSKITNLLATKNDNIDKISIDALSFNKWYFYKNI